MNDHELVWATGMTGGLDDRPLRRRVLRPAAAVVGVVVAGVWIGETVLSEPFEGLIPAVVSGREVETVL